MALRQQFVDAGERARDILGRDGFEHRQPQVEGRATQRGLHRGRVERAAADGQGLVQQRQGVPRGTGRPAHDQIQHLGVGRDAFPAEDVDEVVPELLGRQQRELEVLRAGTDRRQDLVRVGGREHEHDVRRRLFERLQQRVRRRRGEHVDLVDDVHLAARRRAQAEVHALDELPHRLDAVVRRGVELDEVVERAFGDGDAVLARAVGLTVGAEVQAVQRPRQQAGGGRLAGAARAREEVRVTDAILGDRVAQRGGDVVLADQFGEALRSVLPVQAGHAPTLVRLRVRWRPARSRSGDPAAPESFR